jgi:hypothetical protein
VRLPLTTPGELLPARSDASFRGSTTYASLNAHAGEDLGRRDDLWSWLFVVVELAEGEVCDVGHVARMLPR